MAYSKGTIQRADGHLMILGQALLSSQILNWGLYNWVEGKKKLYLHPLEHILKAANLRTYPKHMLGQSATCTTSA
jgi:hypothetical protein